MPNITEIEWNELLGSQKAFQRNKKDQMIKFVASFVVFLGSSIYAYVVSNTQGILLAYFLPFSFLGIITTYLSKSNRELNLIIFILMYVFTGMVAAYSIFIDANSAGLIFFFIVIVLYFSELEKKSTDKRWIIAFAIYCFALAILLPFSLTFKFVLVILTLLLGAYTYSGNDTRAELVELKKQQESYAVYQKHQKLMEHNIINSVTKLKYIEERIKRLDPDEHEELKKLSELMKSELKDIEDTVTNTGKSNLNNFNI